MSQRLEKSRAVLTVGVYADLIEVRGVGAISVTRAVPNPFPFPGIARSDINVDPP